MMLKRFMAFVMLSIPVSMSLLSSSAYAQLYFSDNFDNPAQSQDKWEVITGDWQVADGVYHQLSTASPWQVSMVASGQWDDSWIEYTIEFDVKPLTTGDAPVNVLFRVQDPVPQVWADRNGPNTHMYRWIINGWTNTESRPYIYNAGTATMLAQTSNSLVVGEWHHIKLVVTETGFAGYVNDVQMFDVEHAAWTNGRVGIHAYSGMMDFEDFVVYGPRGGGSPYASSPDPADGALHEDTWVNLSWRPGPYAVSHDVYLGDNFDDVNNAGIDSPEFRGNQTATFIVAGFPGFPYPDGLVPGTTYYWRIDEVNDADPNSPWKGPVWSFSIPPRTAYNPDPSDGAEFVALDATFKWTPGYGAKLHTVYIGTDYDTVNNAAGGAPQGTATYKPVSLEVEKVYYWRVDEFDGIETYKGGVWGFTTPGSAGSLNPANGAVDVQMDSKLTWIPAASAVSHDVYFGTDKDALRNATTASPEFKGNNAAGSESYDLGKLAWHSDYYSRIDAVYNTGTVKGLVWNFTTADFLLVDDFESYNDIDPPDAASNRIFDSWIDGFGTTDNGALVGNDLPPYAEQTIVHGGAQSLVYRYDNAGKTSEATLTLVSPRDWTEEGVTKLSLWFRGGVANSAEKMYIALNGAAVVYHDDSAVTQKGGWNRWVIDLQAFADQGVNLTNVNTITIGIGTKNPLGTGGTGTLYFDDIRLYR